MRRDRFGIWRLRFLAVLATGPRTYARHWMEQRVGIAVIVGMLVFVGAAFWFGSTVGGRTISNCELVKELRDDLRPLVNDSKEMLPPGPVSERFLKHAEQVTRDVQCPSS